MSGTAHTVLHLCGCRSWSELVPGGSGGYWVEMWYRCWEHQRELEGIDDS